MLASVFLLVLFVVSNLVSCDDVLPYDPDMWGPSYVDANSPDWGESRGIIRSFTSFPAKNALDSFSSPKLDAVIEHMRIFNNSGSKSISGHVWRLDNPVGHYSVVEPVGSCAIRARARTSTTAASHRCLVATNAGFFDPRANKPSFGKCLGNVVSMGNPVQFSSAQNANFGLMKNGSFIVGYLPESMVKDSSVWHSLVSGVIWLVKEGRPYVTESLLLEDEKTQFTSNLESFAEVISARSAIGHDREGRLILLTIDGKTWTSRGIDLYRMAEVLISLGVENAINLDGGGSATAVENGTVVSLPSDPCPAPLERFVCERAITTINCIYDSKVRVRNHVELPTVHAMTSWSIITFASLVVILLLFLLLFRSSFISRRLSARFNIPTTV